MAPRRILPWPMLLLLGIGMLFELVPIILAAAGIELKPWPGLLVLCVFLLVTGLVPVVLTAAGIKLTRTRTLIGVVCIGVGATLIFAFGFHLGVGALLVGVLTIASGVYYTFQAYAKLRR